MSAVIALAILHILNQTTTTPYIYNSTSARELATFSSYAYCDKQDIQLAGFQVIDDKSYSI